MAKAKDRFRGKKETKKKKTESAGEKRADSKEEVRTHSEKKYSNKLLDFYDKKYKMLLIIPFVVLLLAIAQIGFQYATTGDFIHKGVSLKGGVTLTVPLAEEMSNVDVQEKVKASLADYDIETDKDISVKSLSGIGEGAGAIIEADITDEDEIESFLELVSTEFDADKADINVDIIGSSLGRSFFKETIIAILVAFLFMGTVVFIYFRSTAPSLAVILAAFSDIVITLAVINIFGMKISTAGIAAFLMLIGYSIDTDILLSTKVLKRKNEGTLMERILDAMKTGMTMTATTIVALIVGIIVSKSQVLDQIMIIVLVGLVIDIMNTWIQNVGILRLYLEKKGAEE